ncbi:MAG: thiamine pyrophosphate-binding protein [Burkholderiales bacterium]|nr:thiamine pyrophosphate-binding protein [Burkholderiales bacterium]
MSAVARERSGGEILVDQLRIQGVGLAFGVPGESYLAVLDAFHDAREAIRFVVCRQEGGAAFMAEAYGKLTGRPGVCFVTRGPGASNAAIGVHTAFQDSTPMILFVGQVGGDFVEREAFQEVDYRRMFGPMAKWVAQIDRADRIPEFVSHAFHAACAGRAGPVVLALPEDMLASRAAVADAGPAQRVQAHPGDAQVRELMAHLARAARPLAIVGGSGWTARACADFQRFAETADLPVATSFRCQDLFDNRHPNYAGDVGIGVNPKLAARVQEADLLLVAGARLGEMTTSGYTLVVPPRPRQKLVHVHAGADELGRVYQADLAINSGMPEFADAVAQVGGIDATRWGEWTRAANADYREWIRPQPMPGALDLALVVRHLAETLPRDAIVTNGAGNYTGWVHRYYQYSPPRTELAPTSGAMGYGVPSAVAAKLVHPQRIVVSFSGDGCFLMNGQELATAVQYGANAVFIVVNNGMYGTIRMHQEREYPGRVYGSQLVNPDFAALARAYGAYGELVERTGDFAPAFERAVTAGRPALLELRIDPEAITTRTTLAAIRAAALKR